MLDYQMNDKEIINDLLHHLYIALPFVEDAAHDESYKPKIVQFHLDNIEQAITNAEAHLHGQISDN